MKKLIVSLASIVLLVLWITKKGFEQEVVKTGPTAASKKSSFYRKLNQRQEKLLNLFEENKVLNMSQIQAKIPSVNVRTLRRDLNQLQVYKMIEKNGSTKSASYKKL